jgi:hypothetical protein
MIHLPTYFIGAPITGEKALAVPAQMAIVVPFAVLLRLLIAWMYSAAGSSVLLGAVLHASFNTASGPAFLDRLGADPAVSLLPLAVVVVLALVVPTWSGLLSPRRVRRARPRVAERGRRLTGGEAPQRPAAS